MAVTSRRRRMYGVSSGCDLDAALAGPQDRKVILPRYRISLELLGVAFIALTAHLGGFLSGVNS